MFHFGSPKVYIGSESGGEQMTTDELRVSLRGMDISFEEKPIQKGIQFRCKSGEIFSVYTTGKLVCGGKITQLSDTVEKHSQGAQPAGAAPQKQPLAQNAIFIVYGHDNPARNELELLLRRAGLNPVILANLAAEGETIIEKLETYIGHAGKAGYACVLLTPDDEGNKAGEAAQKRYRARQNVVLELGMVLAKLGRKRVAILLKKTVERPSDIDGLIYIPFDEKVEEIRLHIFKELEAAGFIPKL
jgi:predicted nucleotide-binding protein